MKVSSCKKTIPTEIEELVYTITIGQREGRKIADALFEISWCNTANPELLCDIYTMFADGKAFELEKKDSE